MWWLVVGLAVVLTGCEAFWGRKIQTINVVAESSTSGEFGCTARVEGFSDADSSDRHGQTKKIRRTVAPDGTTTVTTIDEPD